MARAALGWSVDDLARETGLSRRTVLRLEGGETVAPESIEAMRQAFVKEGIAFDNGGKRAGVSYLRRD